MMIMTSKDYRFLWGAGRFLKRIQKQSPEYWKTWEFWRDNRKRMKVYEQHAFYRHDIPLKDTHGHDDAYIVRFVFENRTPEYIESFFKNAQSWDDFDDTEHITIPEKHFIIKRGNCFVLFYFVYRDKFKSFSPMVTPLGMPL